MGGGRLKNTGEKTADKRGDSPRIGSAGAAFYPGDISTRQTEDRRVFGATYMTMNNPYYQVLDNCLHAELEANGDVLLTRDAAMGQERQNSEIRELIASGVQVIFLTPVEWDTAGIILLEHISARPRRRTCSWPSTTPAPSGVWPPSRGAGVASDLQETLKSAAACPAGDQRLFEPMPPFTRQNASPFGNRSPGFRTGFSARFHQKRGGAFSEPTVPCRRAENSWQLSSGSCGKAQVRGGGFSLR